VLGGVGGGGGWKCLLPKNFHPLPPPSPTRGEGENSASPYDFIERAEQWFQLAPLQHADLGADIEGLRALAQSPWLGRLTSLRLGSDLQGADIRALAGSPFLTNLASLDLYNNRIRDGGLRALSAAPHLGNLKEVRLGWNGIGSAGLVALANSPVLGQLTHLSLFYNEVGGRGAQALAASPTLPVSGI
jgi:hypothetical protein